MLVELGIVLGRQKITFAYQNVSPETVLNVNLRNGDKELYFWRGLLGRWAVPAHGGRADPLQNVWFCKLLLLFEIESKTDSGLKRHCCLRFTYV